MDKVKEQYLVEMCDRLKRNIIALAVVQEPHYHLYDNQNPIHNVRNEVESCAKDMALTILMCLMGYTIPRSLYGIHDYADLCGWLDENEVTDNE